MKPPPMENFIKPAWAALVGYWASACIYFAPLEGLIQAMTIAWVASFAAGYFAGVLTQGERLDTMKFLLACLELLVFTLLILAYFSIGERMESGGVVGRGLSTLTWAFIYYYTTKLSKNLSRLFPKVWILRYLYYLLSLEILKKLPKYKEFTQEENKS